MRSSLITVAADLVRESSTETARPHEPSRLCIYIEAIGACGLLVLVGVTLLTPWN